MERYLFLYEENGKRGWSYVYGSHFAAAIIEFYDYCGGGTLSRADFTTLAFENPRHAVDLFNDFNVSRITIQFIVDSYGRYAYDEEWGETR